MPLYSCKCCNFVTKKKYDFYRHLKTKKHRDRENMLKDDGLNIEQILDDYETLTNDHKMTTNDHQMTTNDHNNVKCKYCNKFFSTKPHVRRHQNYYCTEIEEHKPQVAIKRLTRKMEKDKKRMRRHFEKEKNKLYNQIDKLIDKAGDTNTTINNIQLNNFGEEDTSYINDKILEKLIVYPRTMIPNLLKLTHFDKDHPENKNLQITNKRGKYIKVYKNDEWKLNKRDIVIDNILNNKFDTLETYYVEKGKNSIKSYQQQRFEKFQDDIDCNNQQTLKQVTDDIELTIVNNS